MATKTNCSVVVIGDAKTGKTALIKRLTTDTFSEDYIPTGFDKVHGEVEVDNRKVQLVLWDTSGSPAYDSVRSLSYQEADVFLICYKISDPISLYNVKNKWIGEIRRFRPDAPVVLCGCQSDLRLDPQTTSALARIGRTPVSREQGLAICCEIGAVNFVEASSIVDSRDVHEAFEVCGLAAISRQASMVHHPAEQRVAKRSSSSHSGNRNVLSGEFFSTRNHPTNTNKSSVSSMSLTEHTGTVSSKKSCGSASTHSSLGKKLANISFSGSEAESVCFESSASTTPAQYNLARSPCLVDEKEEDLFASITPRSPRSEEATERTRLSNNNRPLRSSFISSPPLRNESVISASPRQVERFEKLKIDEDSTGEDGQGQKQDFRRPSRLTSAIVSPNSNRKSIIDIVTPSPLTSPTMAQVRPCGLSRRTSFRSQSHTPKAVPTPKSPLSDTSSLILDQQDTLSPLAVSTRKATPKSQLIVSSPNSLAAFDMKQRAGESLKSHASTGSHGSTGSKTSTGSSVLSSDSSTVSGRQTSRDILDPDVPDTEDPELLRQLQFVSPKNGVFRPIKDVSVGGKNGRKKQNCRMM